MIKKLLYKIILPTENSVALCYLRIKLKKYKLISLILENNLIRKYGISVGHNSKIGKRLKMPHPTSIVIGDGVVIGDNVTLYQNVTLGKKMGNINSSHDYPVIGNNVTIFAGAQIIGSVLIGNGSIIGANSVVLESVEENSVYAGIPSKMIKRINCE
ncbi:serine O-acetyltransferase [Salipaludibacillus sp. CF4.18]|uniref:serine O-acetyltransferase n=1 Tax=Salipaludibacillus sp. CF4.18 TaxID=3373081 RepID=UPI003EE806D2